LSDRASKDTPAIFWFRRDLRLADNPGLHAAAADGRPIIAVFVLDETPDIRFPGAAGLWWLDKSLKALQTALEARGACLILRRGEAGKILGDLAKETGAGAVFWNRLYDPGQVIRDADLKAALREDGLEVKSFNAALLIEPWALKTKSGDLFQVFTPFWRAARQLVGDFTLHQAPRALAATEPVPGSESLADWGLHPTKPDWSGGFSDWTPGEDGARAALTAFIDDALETYPQMRDRPDVIGTSRLSPHLHWGEVGPRQIWRSVEAAAHRQPGLESQAEKYFAELGWREFNHHLLFARPNLSTANFKRTFDSFPWRDDKQAFRAWTRGQTGYPFVDAGMRELWGTGFMHNRVRMVAASFLIKHLLIDWRQGERWFWDTLLDADPANNVLNWQWVAGSGADASPFFRIFNPMIQGERFDPDGGYVRRWIPELAKLPAKYIHAPWTAPKAILDQADVVLGGVYPKPIVDHDAARGRALDAFKSLRAED
jgi:deoxyribodipyrimidine photo-lyase